jgi:hypothetical protein
VNPINVPVTVIEEWLNRLYIAAEGAGLRQEDRRKALELRAMLAEIERLARRMSAKSKLVLVDAAAGKSYVGLLAAKLLFEPAGRPAEIIAIERVPRHVMLSRRAVEILASTVPIEIRLGDLSDGQVWPMEPGIVVALHACGSAADLVIQRAIQTRAKSLLLVPCCVANSMDAVRRASVKAEALGFPGHAAIRRRFIQATVDAERTWRLEAAGYQTEVVDLCAPTVTPQNLLWRARRVCEPARMARSAKALEKW